MKHRFFGRILVTILILTMVCGLIPEWTGMKGQRAQAESLTPMGSGTISDPYLIADADDLWWISLNNNSVPYSGFAGSYFRQTADIDLEGMNWISIGDVPTPFCGEYDGDGYVISNLTIGTSPKANGVFDTLGTSGIIKNLGVVNVRTATSELALPSVGALLVTNAGGTVTGCYSTGVIAGNYFYVGGLVGGQNNGNINNCYSTCTVRGTDHVGGLIGVLYGGSINNCYTTGTIGSYVSPGGYMVGGISAETCSSLINCFSTSTLPTTGMAIGGIAAFLYSYGESIGNISYCNTSNTKITGEGFDYTNSEVSLDPTYFKLKSNYNDIVRWDISPTYAWDFNNMWSMDGSVNNGYPYFIRTRLQDITGANLTGMIAPTAGGAPITKDSLSTLDASYTIESIAWKNADGSDATLTAAGDFMAGSVYKAIIVLSSKTGYKFQAGGFQPAVNTGTVEAGVVSGSDGSGNQLTFTLTFPQTAGKTVTNMVMASQPTRLSYTTGETLNLEGLAVTLTYNDKTSAVIGLSDFAANGITASPANGTVMTIVPYHGNPVTITCNSRTASTGNLSVTNFVPADNNSGSNSGSNNNSNPTSDSDEKQLKVNITNGSNHSETTMITELAEGEDTAKVIVPASENTQDGVQVGLTKDLLGVLEDRDVNLEINTQFSKINIPKETIAKLDTKDGEELFFRFQPTLSEKDKDAAEKRVKQNAQITLGVMDSGLSVVSTPMVIESNISSGSVGLTLPLEGVNLPSGKAEREDFLSSLSVFVEHSDGTKEVIKGEIVEYKTGVYGIRFNISKFSTFTIIHVHVVPISEQINILTVTSPKKAKVTDRSIKCTVDYKTTKVKLKLKVSNQANWKLYTDARCMKEVDSKTMKLKIGTNTAYIKVTAVDGSSKIYKVHLTRKAK